MMIKMENLTKVLVSMGYRSISSDDKKVWMKPIAFATVACFKDDDKLKFGVHFKDLNGNPAVWSSYDIDLTEFYNDPKLDLTLSVKLAEQHLLDGMCFTAGSESSSYEFMTKLDTANLLSNLF